MPVQSRVAACGPRIDRSELLGPNPTVLSWAVATLAASTGLFSHNLVGSMTTGLPPAIVVATDHPTSLVFALDLTLLVPWQIIAALAMARSPVGLPARDGCDQQGRAVCLQPRRQLDPGNARRHRRRHDRAADRFDGSQLGRGGVAADASAKPTNRTEAVTAPNSVFASSTTAAGRRRMADDILTLHGGTHHPRRR